MFNKWSNILTNWENASSKTGLYAIPIIVFCLVIVFAIISGFRRGIWGGITIMCFSLLGLGISIGVAPLISNEIIKKIDLKNATLGISTKDDVKVIIELFNGLIMFGIVVIFNIFAEILIAILKKPITKHIEVRKQAKKLIEAGQLENNSEAAGKKEKTSTALTRISGGLIAGFSIIPTAVLSANPIGAITYKSDFVKTNDKMLNALSFKKAIGVARFSPGLIGLANIGLDFINKKESNQTIAYSIEKYFQQFYNQDNYMYKGQPKPKFNKTTGEWESPTIDVQFYFALKEVNDVNNKENYVDEKIPRFYNGDMQKIIDKFTETDESLKLLELIMSKINTSVYENSKSELEKFIEMAKKLESLGIKPNFENIEIFSKSWQKLKVPKKYLNDVRRMVLKIAKLDKISLENPTEEVKKSPEYKIRYIIQKMLDTFIVEK